MSGERHGNLRIAAQSPFTYSMAALSVGVLSFTQLQGGPNFFGMVVALLLMAFGFIGAEKFKVVKEEDSPTEPLEIANIVLVTLLLTSLFAVFDYLIPKVKFSQNSVTYQTFYGQFAIPLSQPSALIVGNVTVPSWLPAFLFVGVLMPNSEEQYFRGFWGNLAISQLGFLEGFAYMIAGGVAAGAAVIIATILAATPAGLLFGLSHTPAYNGSLPVILTLSADGTMVVALSSLVGRLEVAILAHMANNTISFALQQSTLLSLIPNLPPSPVQAFAPMVLPMVLICVAVYKRKHPRMSVAVRMVGTN